MTSKETPAANDAEARYWAALDETARQRAQALQIEGWGTGTDGPASSNKAKICDVYYFHTDQVGLPEELSNSQGQLVWRASYKTWGSTVAEDWSIVDLDGGQVHELDKGDRPTEDARQQNLRFQGQYLDRDTGLHYNTFRYYDPDIGRFISPDPIGLNGGINLGSYSPNPISWIDPWGWAGKGYTVSGQVAGTDTVSRGAHLNVHGPGLPAGGGHVGFIPNADGTGLIMTREDAATRALSDKQWSKVQDSVKAHLDNPREVDRLAKIAQIGVDNNPNGNRTPEMRKVQEIARDHHNKGTNPC